MLSVKVDQAAFSTQRQTVIDARNRKEHSSPETLLALTAGGGSTNKMTGYAAQQHLVRVSWECSKQCRLLLFDRYSRYHCGDLPPPGRCEAVCVAWVPDAAT
jgi:hypothetical protein